MSKNQQINKIKEDLSKTVKVLIEDDEVKVDFAGNFENNFFNFNQNLVTSDDNISLPILQVDDFLSDEEILRRNRCAADLAVCYYLFHDEEIHKSFDFILDEKKLFDEFEKIRVVLNIEGSFLGVLGNILSKIEDDIYSTNNPLQLILLKEFFVDNLSADILDFIGDLEKILSNKILSKIKNLRSKISNQLAFAKEVEVIIEMLRKEREEEKKRQKKQENNKDDVNNSGSKDTTKKDKKDFLPQEKEEENSSDSFEEKTQEQEIKIDEDGEKSNKKVRAKKQKFREEKIEFKNPYKVFSSQFDEIIYPQKLVSKSELEILRDQLDLKMSSLNKISKKMTLKLKRKLLSKKISYIENDANRGILDRKKLNRLLVDPLNQDVWINNKDHQYQDTILTILLDNSGSMRGSPIVMSALTCEIIAEILENFSIKTEIIGFTTSDWRGGRVRKLWEAAGCPKNPGRLNQIRHIIYKSFNQSFKKAKVNLGMMLKEGILKENIDGEALLFAKSRLESREEKRKILMVISDGTPVDDSTISANDPDFLSNHLIHVIHKIERHSSIEVVGIGIGHSTKEFYKNSMTIKSLEDLGDAMIEKIVDLI